MNTLAEFTASMNDALPESNWLPQLKSLWYDKKGNWNRAHA
jgi:hypothetical protein